MRVSRFFVAQDLAPECQVTVSGKPAHYLQRVLKLRVGDALVLFNGDGSDYAGEVAATGKERVDVALHARLPAVAESGLHLTLAQAVGKGDRMDYALQKATELGVTAVQPLFTKRTEVRLKGERLERRMGHWLGVLRSACEQCGRATVPDLLPARGLDEWQEADTSAWRLVLDPGSGRTLSELGPPPGPVTILVGPEGGFEDSELRQLKLAACQAVRLGPRVLRTETAGPAVLAALQTLWGDFGPDHQG